MEIHNREKIYNRISKVHGAAEIIKWSLPLNVERVGGLAEKSELVQKIAAY